MKSERTFKQKMISALVGLAFGILTFALFKDSSYPQAFFLPCCIAMSVGSVIGDLIQKKFQGNSN